jgi:hypothetical protein
MRLVLGSLPQMLVMASVVTTALYVPVLAILALLSIALFGVPLRSFVTFGEALGVFDGLVVWWIVLFVPALAYSMFMMPWDAKKD